MPISENDFYKTRATIVSDMLESLVALVPDAYTGEDGIIRILFDVEAGQFENIFLANQLLLEDLFVQTASQAALRLHGEQFGLAFKDGLKSVGSLKFAGQGGTYIPFNTEAAYDPGTGVDPVYFVTTVDGNIPNLGIPTALTGADAPGSGNLGPGTYNYKVTFGNYASGGGETAGGADSAPIVTSGVANHQINLSNIPVGGPGTLDRRIYRQKNGTGDYKLAIILAGNVATTVTDNVADASLTTILPTVDTSNKISLAAEAQEPGIEGNVLANSIVDLTNAPSGLTDVTNVAPFTGGADPEDTEDFRQRLLNRIRSPQTGSPDDLKSWAEAIDGVETATVFSNNNLGVTQAGHTTVRISGPNGSVPGASVINAVAAALAAYDFANITIHVTTFTPVSTNVSVTLTLVSGFTHTDVDNGVALAITDYINSLDVGGTLYISGIVDAVFGLAGVADVVVTVPASNQTTAADSKRTPGTITIT